MTQISIGQWDSTEIMIDPFTRQPIENDPLMEYYKVHNAIARFQMQIIALQNHLLMNIIPRLAISREGAEIDKIARELLNWDCSDLGDRNDPN